MYIPLSGSLYSCHRFQCINYSTLRDSNFQRPKFRYFEYRGAKSVKENPSHTSLISLSSFSMSLSTILVSVKLCLSSESTLVTRSRDLTLSPPKGI